MDRKQTYLWAGASEEAYQLSGPVRLLLLRPGRPFKHMQAHSCRGPREPTGAVPSMEPTPASPPSVRHASSRRVGRDRVGSSRAPLAGPGRRTACPGLSARVRRDAPRLLVGWLVGFP
jgi:hypothetical protein